MSVFCGINLNSESSTHLSQEGKHFCTWQFYIPTGNIIFNEIFHLLSQKMKKQKQIQKYIITFLSVVSAAWSCKVSHTFSDVTSKATAGAIPCVTQLFRVPTWDSCCYSKPGLGQCTTWPPINFSPLFQVLTRAGIVIPSWATVNALLGLLQ